MGSRVHVATATVQKFSAHVISSGSQSAPCLQTAQLLLQSPNTAALSVRTSPRTRRSGHTFAEKLRGGGDSTLFPSALGRVEEAQHIGSQYRLPHKPISSMPPTSQD